MRISKHFTLTELTHTNHGGVDNTPGPDELTKLFDLTRRALEPIRERFGPIRVTSGFRCKKLNDKIGGAMDSAHLYGCAADIQAINGASPTEIVSWVVMESGIDYDQVIDEQRGSSKWVHIGMLRPGHEQEARRQALSMFNGVYEVFHVEQEKDS